MEGEYEGERGEPTVRAGWVEGDEGVSGILKRRRVGERARELGADFTLLESPRPREAKGQEAQPADAQASVESSDHLIGINLMN